MKYQPWSKLMADLPERKAHYTDAQFRAFIELLAAASASREPGTFPSLAAVRRITGASTAFLVEQADLVVADDGSVAVHGWSKYQRPFDEGHAARQAAYELRKNDVPHDASSDANSSSSDWRQNGSSTSTSSSSSSTSTENGSNRAGANDGDDPLDVYWQLTGRYPSAKAKGWIESLVETFGPKNVGDAIATAYVTNPRTFLGLADDLLKRAATKAEQAERKRAEDEKRAARGRPRSEPTRISADPPNLDLSKRREH